MSDLLAVPSTESIDATHFASLTDAINLSGRLQLDKVEVDGWMMAATYHHDAPLVGPRVYSDDRWSAVFAGDLVGCPGIPFEDICDDIEGGGGSILRHLNGVFCIAAYDKLSRRLHCVSDRRSQKPLFYRAHSRQLHIASTLAAFSRFHEKPEFEPQWLCQLLYFNFPVDGTTFLRNVKRLPPATVLRYDRETGEVELTNYAEPFRARDKLLRGPEGLRHAANVFAERVPLHFDGSGETACALTAGWDCRTLLALAPAGKEVKAYTYGIPGCNDVVTAAAAAQSLGVEHIQIPFDEAFVQELPHHALESTYLSAGLQNVLRSSLHFAYGCLTDRGQRFPLTVSGMVLDLLFRGHARCPNLVSADLARHFRLGRAGDVGDQWCGVFDSDRDFSNLILTCLHTLESDFGPLDSTEHHLLYNLYLISRGYYGGEISLSNQFTTVRVPAWDADLIELAFSIEQSTLSFSQHYRDNRRGDRKEMILQAYLLRELAPNYYRLLVKGRAPAAILAGELAFRLQGMYHGIRRRIGAGTLSPNTSQLENWPGWLFERHSGFVKELLQSSDTLIVQHINPVFIDRTIAERDQHMLGKLMTAEIVLRLIATKWQRFW